MRAKEIEPTKPRNFVAKNAKMGGAGAHKDKKKAQKQGDVKHKGKEISEGISYGQMGPALAQQLLAAYKETSQGVEQYRDKEGAEKIYNALKQVAKENNGGQYLRSLMNSASNSAHMDFDTNPGGFENWFTYVGDHLEGLVNLMKEKGTITDEPDVLPDEEKISMKERFRDPEDWDEGNTEPPNNFAVYINGKKWKVFKGRGYYADDERERAHYYQLQDWARKKSDATGKKWTVHTTGEAPTA